MTYILLIISYGSHITATVTATEFKTKVACEAALAEALKITTLGTPAIWPNSRCIEVKTQ